jgi:acetolactate synthase I/II/III large subunit
VTAVRVADYVARGLAAHGIRHVFMVTGGAAMHLNDAIGRCRELEYVCVHHEQAASMAAQGYYRLTNRLAAVNVTAGPGATNAITGVFGAWTDSLGMVVVSGQVKWETLVRSTALPLRQLGDQEVDIVRLVEPITKYAVLVDDPARVRYHLERAIHLARSGRPGPVWLDIPGNVQSAMVEPDALEGYTPDAGETPDTDVAAACAEIARGLARAERPVLLAGAGVRLAGAADAFARLAGRLGIPVVTGFNAHDLLPTDHPVYVGRQGTIGDRAGNFAVQNADYVLILGCRLNIRQVSYAWQHFARGATKVMVDVDAAELRKPTLAIDLPVHADVGQVIGRLETALADTGPTPAHDRWLAWCRERKARYPVVLPEYWRRPGPVNPYCFAQALFEAAADDETVVTGDATACITTFQAAALRAGQRLFSDSGCAPMGFDLPAAIGACVAQGRRRVVCLAGDGSIMFNLQELQTIAGLGLPIKIFVLNNNGYLSIRLTQTNFFPDNPVGAGPESGVTFPDFGRLAHGFGLPFRRCETHAGLRDAIRATLDGPGPQMCEIVLDPAQAFSPRVSSKRLPDGRMVTAPLEDMFPFLPREEFVANMVIPPVAEE